MQNLKNGLDTPKINLSYMSSTIKKLLQESYIIILTFVRPDPQLHYNESKQNLYKIQYILIDAQHVAKVLLDRKL